MGRPLQATVICLLALLFCLPLSSGKDVLSAAETQGKPRLAELYPMSELSGMLIPRDSWRPYASIVERGFWESLPAEVRKAHIELGERALEKEWPLLPATLYLDYARTGNRRHYEVPYFERRRMVADLVLAECMEDRGRFLDAIADGVWLILEESSWCIPAHIAAQKAGSGLPDTEEPIVDLFAAETVALLAWTHYLMEDRLDGVSPMISGRIEREARERVLGPCFERDDFWWLGFEADHVNNWNPWVNSNWITASLLLEKDPERRLRALHKSMRSLDIFIDSYHMDGGCDEGPSYWGRAGASLFDCLELLHSATGGGVDVYGNELIRDMGRFIYRAHIDGKYFINFADAPAVVTPNDDLLHRYGKRIGDEKMQALGAWFAQERLAERPLAAGAYIGRRLPALGNIEELMAARGYQPLVRDVWLDGIQVMAAREQEGSPGGLYMAAKGGHNAESHNHNDVGNFIIYAGGEPAIVDAGVGTYTRKTFSSERYDIWTMQSAYHNLPTVNGVMQREGAGFRAGDVSYSAGNSRVRFSMELGGAYPEEAGIESWRRSLEFDRGGKIELEEQFLLARREGDLMLSLLTPCRVDTGEEGRLLLHGRDGSFVLAVDFPAGKLTPRTETIEIDDERLGRAWGSSLTRITLSAPAGSPVQDTWNVGFSLAR